MVEDSTRRLLVKSIGWRLIAASLIGLATYVASTTLERAATVSMAVITVDLIGKTTLYYLYEIAWNRSTWERTFAPCPRCGEQNGDDDVGTRTRPRSPSGGW